MSVQINKESYEKLIIQDIEWLKDNTNESLERTHIVKVLTASIDLLFPENNRKE